MRGMRTRQVRGVPTAVRCLDSRLTKFPCKSCCSPVHLRPPPPSSFSRCSARDLSKPKPSPYLHWHQQPGRHAVEAHLHAERGAAAVVYPLLCRRIRSHIRFADHDSVVFAWTRPSPCLLCLLQHDLVVADIDWSHATNKIVTCSHDRNAFVWSLSPETDEWKPALVILRIQRAAMCCRWTPDGRKFSVGSGAKCVPIAHYESDQDWWISKMIKKHKST